MRKTLLWMLLFFFLLTATVGCTGGGFLPPDFNDRFDRKDDIPVNTPGEEVVGDWDPDNGQAFIIDGVEMTEEEFKAYLREQNQDDFDYYGFGHTGGYGNGYVDATSDKAYNNSVDIDVLEKLRKNSDYVAGYQDGYAQGYTEGLNESEGNGNNSGNNGEDQTVTNHRDFPLTSYAGDVYTLNNFSGSPVLMCIWGSWCPSCKAKLEDWQQLYIESQDYDFAFITVVMPSHYGEMSKQDFYDWWETEYVLISLLNDEDARFVNHFGLESIPVYLVFGSDGELLWIYENIPSNEAVMADMEDVMASGY